MKGQRFYIETDLDELDVNLGFTGPLLIAEIEQLLKKHACFLDFLNGA